MKCQKSLVYLVIAILSFLFSCGKDKTTNPDINTPPNASFTVNPTSGTPDTVFNVDASGSSDNQDPTSILQVRWDWENDGTYDTDWTTNKAASHQYSSIGIKTIKLEVKDTGGLTDTETHYVTVEPPGGCPTVSDYDGNLYQTVQIGDQCWMAENLKVTHYRNGDAIPNVTANTDWVNLTTGAFCHYDNDSNNVATYGRLYNWYAVDDSRNIAPEGWHVPTDEEWKQLEMYLGMSQSEADADGYRGTDEGGKLKAMGTIEGGDGLWYEPNTGATNESGFSVLPGGYRANVSGYFFAVGYEANFWTSKEYDSHGAWYRLLHHDNSIISRYGYFSKQCGFSVRCLRDRLF